MENAIDRYRRAVQQSPQNNLAQFSLGKALFEAGDWAAAKEPLQFALDSKPDWMVAAILIGKCESALGRRDEARAAFQKALQLAIDQRHDGPQAEIEELLANL